jgi:hypothetical protein
MQHQLTKQAAVQWQANDAWQNQQQRHLPISWSFGEKRRSNSSAARVSLCQLQQQVSDESYNVLCWQLVRFAREMPPSTATNPACWPLTFQCILKLLLSQVWSAVALVLCKQPCSLRRQHVASLLR